MQFTKNVFPQRIICLTEESVETLYALGKQELIKGVSAFVKRPKEAQKLPKVSFFTDANIDKILAKKPDLVLGFSDIQKDIAKDLIGAGVNVMVANHRSLQEVLDYILLLSRMVDAKDEGELLFERCLREIERAQEFARTLQQKPRVYFEEWDDPMIGSIRWVSELIELCGGVDINKELSMGTLAKERFVNPQDIVQKNPDIIFGCWCGKKVKIDQITGRVNWDKINAVEKRQVFELEPEIFLQPGPALFLDGISLLVESFKKWSCL